VLAKALELDAKDPAIYNAFALLAMKQGKAQEAFLRFEQAVEIDANYIDARFNKASVLLDAGDYAQPRLSCRRLSKRDPMTMRRRSRSGSPTAGSRSSPRPSGRGTR